MKWFDFLIQNDQHVYNKMVTLKQKEGLGMDRNWSTEAVSQGVQWTNPLEFRK